MKLHPQQKKDRDLLVVAIPDENERWAACMGIAKSASHLAQFICSVSDFIDVPEEIKYRIGLILSFCSAVWIPHPESNKSVMMKYKEELSKQDIDDRFQLCFMYLYEEAKIRGWVK